jgi:hypothetical protein
MSHSGYKRAKSMNHFIYIPLWEQENPAVLNALTAIIEGPVRTVPGFILLLKKIAAWCRDVFYTHFQKGVSDDTK